MEKLRIALFTDQRVSMPSQTIRVIEPIAFLGPRVQLDVCTHFGGSGLLTIDTETWKLADIVIIQRNFPSIKTIDLIRKIAFSGKRVVYDADDAIALIPDDHEKAYHKVNVPQINEAAAIANVVVVSTEELSRCFTDARRVLIAPNMLSPRIWNEKVLCPPPRSPLSHRVRIALVGGGFHLDDFLSIAPALCRAQDTGRVDWVTYGDGALSAMHRLKFTVAQHVNLDYNYATHPHRLASLDADIALLPLQDNGVNRCKSDIKFLEFGWLGVTCVASQLPPYAIVNSYGGMGISCSSDAEWSSALVSMIENPDVRNKLGSAAQGYVRKMRTLNPQRAEKWLSMLIE